MIERTDLSDVDVVTITDQLNRFRQQLTQQFNQGGEVLEQGRSFSIIQANIENYVLNSPLWYLRPDSLDRGFREVLYDPDADAGLVRQQLERLNRSYFADVLRRREGLSSQQVNDIADALEVIRQELLDTVRVTAKQARSQQLRHQVETCVIAS